MNKPFTRADDAALEAEADYCESVAQEQGSKTPLERAAPDLLAALKAALPMLESLVDYDDPDVDPSDGDPLQFVYDAIAKAEGGAP